MTLITQNIPTKNLERLLRSNPKAELARRNFKDFISLIKPQYQFKFFHDYIISRLQAFERGEIKKLMICMPPQHGKSELSSRLFPAWLLGKNPYRKIAILSYSSDIAHEFARDAKNYISSADYRQVFPKVQIGKIKDSDSSYGDASYYYQTNPQNGYIYSTGVGGALTSKTVDIGIIDDPFKDREEAMSLTIREKRWKFYVDVYKTRMHNNSQEMFMTTRWDKDDLAGRILDSEKDWETIIFPAIRTADFNLYDERNKGEVLFPEKHSLENILSQKSKSEATFNALYQQDPKPNSNVLVHKFTQIDRLPIESIERWIVGLDYGFTNDPTAVIAIGCWGNNRYWKPLLRAKESSGNRELVNVSADEIKEVLQRENLIGRAMYSEHNPDMILQLRKLGLPVQQARKNVYAGIKSVNDKENYYVYEKFFHDELINYQYKTIGDIILNDPIDGNDHYMNAGRYAIYTDEMRG